VRRVLAAAALGVALSACSNSGSASGCGAVHAAASGYVADYGVGASAASAYAVQVRAMPTYQSDPSLQWVQFCDQYAPGYRFNPNVVTPGCPQAAIDAALAWERSLQAQGIGTMLPLGADVTAVTAFEDAVANPQIARMNAIRSTLPQAARPTDQDAKLYDAVVDQNPTCFTPEVRAQVRVNEGG